MSHFTSVQEAALLKIPRALKSCYTGSCQHPLTTASSAESCPKTCFLQATFTVCCHKALFLLSQQTNVRNFAFLNTGILLEEPQGNIQWEIFFPLLWKQYGQRKEKIFNHACPSAVTFKLQLKQQRSTLHKYFLLYCFPNKMAPKSRSFFLSQHGRDGDQRHLSLGDTRKKPQKQNTGKGSDSFSFLVFFQLLRKSFCKLLRFDFNWSPTWDPEGKETISE